MFAEKDVSYLIENYVSAALAHGEATKSGDYSAANRAYENIAAIYRELRSRGISAQNSLLPLLNHMDIAVRCWAASHALEFAPDQGIITLEALSKSQGIWRLKAATILKEWKKGSLKFP
jgi:hypothetical protein